MAIAMKLQDYLSRQGMHYDVVHHPHSVSSMETAQLAHVPGKNLAKSVILEDEDGYLMAILPSTRHVRLGVLGKALKRRLRLATEDELATLFEDCEIGAVPPVGAAYGLRTVIDDSLTDQPEIYFEAGDHESLIRVSRENFLAMMHGASHMRFGEHHRHHH
jgi:Ala-tRNA(Pro) deacylase